MRTLDEIYNQITGSFMESEHVQDLYKLDGVQSFKSVFSKASIEGIIFYIMAFALWVHEKIIDTYKTDMETFVRNMKPHTTLWYKSVALQFLYNIPFDDKESVFLTEGKTDKEIEDAQIIKYASAVDYENSVTVKVCTEKDGTRCPLSKEEQTAFQGYISRIKDAGIRVRIVNENPDVLSGQITVYYDSIMDVDKLKKECYEAIKDYIQNLPFDGMYSNMALVDRLQAVSGVTVAEVKKMYSKPCTLADTANSADTLIDTVCRPHSGYYKIAGLENLIKVEMKPY